MADEISSCGEPLTEREQAMLAELQRKQDAINEIERRNDVRLSNKHSYQSCEPCAGQEPLAILDSQTLLGKNGYTFAIVNKANRVLNPPCKRPAFRILGLFRSVDGDYKNWIDELHENNLIYVDPEDKKTKCKLGDLHKVPILKYMLIPKNMNRDRDETYTKTKIEEIKKIYLENMEMAQREFEEHREKRVQGKMGLSLEKQRETAKEKRKKSARGKVLNEKGKQTSSEIREVSRVPRIMELINQKHAVIIILNDVTKETLAGKDDPEPAVLIIDTFDSCNEAEEYMETLKNYVFCMNIDVVDMYVWHFPEDVDFDNVKEKYRDAEQNKVMNEKKSRKMEVNTMEAKARMENKPLPINEVTEKSRSPENFQPLKQNPEFTYTESSQPVDREQLKTEEQERLKKMNTGEYGNDISPFYSSSSMFNLIGNSDENNLMDKLEKDKQHK